MKKIDREKELNKKTKWMTLDYDGRLPFIRWAYFDMIKFSKSAQIYKTKHGWHVLVELRTPMTLRKIIYIRKLLGDDKQRTEHDSNYPSLSNRMFTEKEIISEVIKI